MKRIRYTKATVERLTELLERIGWQVQKASTDGSYKRIHLPNGKFSGYWIKGIGEVRIEHDLDDFRGGITFYLKDCFFEMLGQDTVCIVGKVNKSLFISFNNFKDHRE